MDLITRMQRVVKDLETIEAELFGSASQRNVLDTELSEDLRHTVDRIRRLLWCHTSAAKGTKHPVVDHMLEQYRLQQAVALFRETAARRVAQEKGLPPVC